MFSMLLIISYLLNSTQEIEISGENLRLQANPLHRASNGAKGHNSNNNNNNNIFIFFI